MASRLVNFVQIRFISISATLSGKRNFRKFNLYGKRGTSLFKSRYFGNDKQIKRDKELEYLYNRGCRPTGITNENGRFEDVPEMHPELIVPNLEGFNLKPYVSYRVPDVVQDEFTPQDLFYAVYSKKIADDFKSGKLSDDGSPLEPSEFENLTVEEARSKAQNTGSDIPFFRDYPE